MISEELELNGALEAAGVRVVETDLGEFVVQVAGEHPSHIIGPIIHKSKDDVAALFEQKLGATPSDVADVPHMAAFARRLLRAEFLRADMGISGANFGIAETGSLCIVTNEGNGRLTTTVPRVHVALMGIERVVPSFADLGLMLQLLARSATGQPLTVYTNIISGPRRRGPKSAAGDEHGAGEPDGPDELHVVLVDNGRSSLLGTELAEILHCIRCGACLNVCPVYQSVGGHAYGTVYMGPVGSVLTPALRGLGPFGELPHASSLCGACREICPVRIDIPRMLLALRAQGVRERRGPAWITFGLAFYARLAKHPRTLPCGGAPGQTAARAESARRVGSSDARTARRMDRPAGLSASRRQEFSGPVARAPEAPVVSGRATVLGNISANLRRGGGAVHGARHPAEVVSAAETGSTPVPIPQDLLVERFSAELTAIAGRVHRPGTTRRSHRRSHGRVPRAWRVAGAVLGIRVDRAARPRRGACGKRHCSRSGLAARMATTGSTVSPPSNRFAWASPARSPASRRAGRSQSSPGLGGPASPRCLHRCTSRCSGRITSTRHSPRFSRRMRTSRKRAATWC